MRYVLIVSLILNAGLLYWYVFRGEQPQGTVANITAENNYPLLSADILHDLQRDVLINFYPLRTELREAVEPYGDDFGFYFEYLPTGTSISVNSNDEFYAASLFKVPVVMAYYHGKERKRMTDDPEVEIKQEHLDKEFGDLWKKGAGTKMKASELVRLSLVESDNTAIKALLPIIEQQDFVPVYNGLDIDLHADNNGALISARTYASILKALHYSSVLNKEDSEEILQMLSETPFKDKIVAGVPENINVAHKIGDFSAGETDQGYRDCGIVYEPRRPYILCMFSKSDEATARERMKMVSSKVYKYVSTVAK